MSNREISLSQCILPPEHDNIRRKSDNQRIYMLQLDFHQHQSRRTQRINSMNSYAIASKSIRFWTYLIPFVPSISCSIFVLYQYLFDRTLRKGLHNHIFIAIIGVGFISQVTVYPWMLYNYHITEIWQRSHAFCTIWHFTDMFTYTLQCFLFAWASFERHILIFHDRWLQRKRVRFVLHYLPIMVIIVYCFIVYGITFLFPPCENIYWDSYIYACVWPCLWLNQQWNMFELFFNSVLPVCLIVMFSLLLFIRVIWMKSQMRQGNHWRRNAKMAVQLFSIITMYLIFIMPYTIILLVLWFYIQTDIVMSLNYVFQYLSYFPLLLNPFICVLSSNELRTRLVELFRQAPHHRGTIIPSTLISNTRNIPVVS